MALRLVRYAEVRGTIHCLTGTRVGGSKDDIEIGGMDNPVIRNPLTRLPYIPGSSLKGKLRSLLEYRYGLIEGDGAPSRLDTPDSPVARLFGPHMRPQHGLGPSRLIFRDAALTAESTERLRGLLEVGLEYAEVKAETMVDRRTQIARSGTLRTQERVPEGTEFKLTINVRLFEEDDPRQLLAWLGEALEWLPKDTLGGSGTRGYGWVELRELTLDGEPWTPPSPPAGWPRG